MSPELREHCAGAMCDVIILTRCSRFACAGTHVLQMRDCRSAPEPDAAEKAVMVYDAPMPGRRTPRLRLGGELHDRILALGIDARGLKPQLRGLRRIGFSEQSALIHDGEEFEGISLAEVG